MQHVRRFGAALVEDWCSACGGVVQRLSWSGAALEEEWCSTRGEASKEGRVG